ncbi:MarR family transcriptional regulator [Acidothermaceae bacterium B102]|nr:MarR family transcriptional regulator [Acidothermaceae bacterium B102]
MVYEAYHQQMRTTERAMDRLEEQAGREVRRGVTSLAARARSERPGTLTTTTVAALGQLARHGAMTAGEMAHRLRTSPQALTRTLAAALDHHFLERMPDPDDGRQALLTITAEGREALRQDMHPRDVWLAEVMAAELTEAERDLLVVASRLMLRLADVDASPGVVER